MNKLNRETQVQVIKSLIEGNSIRATVRLTGAAKDTVTKLLVAVGSACADHQDRALRNIKAKWIQCEEIWSFVYAKEKNIPADKKGHFGYGHVWTWVATDADMKLAPAFMVGNRDPRSARMFIDDLAGRIRNRIQLTTDGLKVYLEAVEEAFGANTDYAVPTRFTSGLRERRGTAGRSVLGASAKQSWASLIPIMSPQVTRSART